MGKKEVSLSAEESEFHSASRNEIEDENSRNIEDINVGWIFWRKRRYAISLLIFFGLFTSYLIRVNLSLAILTMTKKSDGNEAEFDWSETVQGLVMGSFFYGYATTQLLGGWLSSKIGGKKVFGIGIGVSALLTILTPPLTRINVYLLITLRIIEGVIEGGTYPCIHAILANWAPPLERSKLATFSFTGAYVGMVFGNTASGIMIRYLGWASVFYGFGVIGIIWFILWWLIVFDKPEEDPGISEYELQYIKQSLGTNNNNENEKHPIPWKAILTSAPMWAIFAAHFSENWGFYTMMTQLPAFMHDVLHYEIEATGFFSSLPYVVTSFTLPLAGFLADYVRSKNFLTTNQVRKLFNCGAFVAQAFFMISMTLIESSAAAVACVSIAVGFTGFGWVGFGVNFLDIAPQHASVLLGLSNTIATIPGIVSPSLTGLIVKNKTREEWKYVFLIVGGNYLISAVIYGIFASGEKQKWADDSKKKDSIEETTR